MRADFDYRRLGHVLRSRLSEDGRGWRACGAEIGVAPTALSRICAGQAVAAHSVIAICQWLGVDMLEFYDGPAPGGCFTGRAVKQGGAET